MPFKLSLQSWQASPQRPLEVLLVGIGGIGSLYGFLLQRGAQRLTSTSDSDDGASGVKMSLVARSNYDAIQSNGGVDVQSKKYGTGKLKHDHLYKSVAEAVQGVRSRKTGYDLIVCTTKALFGQGTTSTVDLLRPAVECSPEACIVAIQNGLGIEEPLHAAFPDHVLVGCTAYTGVWSDGPASVQHAALDRVEAGVYPECSPSNPIGNGGTAEAAGFVIPDPAESGPAAAERASQTTHAEYVTAQRNALELFLTLLSTADCDTVVLGSIVAARWRKLVWNASFNPVCALLDFDTAQVAACPAAESLVREAMAEVCAAARSDGVQLDTEQLIESNWTTTRKIMSAYKPSMQLDRANNRPMELQVILGEPIRRATENGVEVPTLKSCLRVLQALEWRDAQQGK